MSLLGSQILFGVLKAINRAAKGLRKAFKDFSIQGSPFSLTAQPIN